MNKQDDSAVKVKLVHFNDTHSHIEPTQVKLKLPLQYRLSDKKMTEVLVACGGYVKFISYLKQLRRKAASDQVDLLCLHAGDSFEGTLYFSCFKGKANIELLNIMKIDAMTIGNHELDTGADLLAEFIQQAQFPLMSANLHLQHNARQQSPLNRQFTNLICHNNPAHSQRYMTKVINGHCVAIFGLSIDSMEKIADPGPGILFLDAIETARKVMADIHKEGIRSVILLSHLGHEKDKELAAEVEGISLIVGGHTHTLQGDFSNIGWNCFEPYACQVNNTFIVQAGSNALCAGVMDIGFHRNGHIQYLKGGNKVLLENNLFVTDPHLQKPEFLQQIRDYLQQQPNICFVKNDPDAMAIIKHRYHPSLQHFKQDIVAQVSRPLRHIRVPDEQGGSQIAPIVADSLLKYAINQGKKTDFAIFNAGAARISLPRGKLTAADIAGRLLPFPIDACYVSVPGRIVRQALAESVGNAIDNTSGTGSFPYTANLRFEYDRLSPVDDKIVSVHFLNDKGNWTVLEDHHIYHLVTTSYIAAGKEGYHPFDNHRVMRVNFNTLVSDIFIEYARALKVLRVPDQI